MKELLQSTLRSATWPEPRERDKVKAWMKEIGERVKKRMLGTYYAPCYILFIVPSRTLDSDYGVSLCLCTEIQPRDL